MPALRRHLIGLTALVAAAATAGSAAAAPPQDPCITFGQSTVNATYNPFSGGGLSVANLTLTVNRWNAPKGGGKTQSAGFIFLTKPGQPAGFEMTYQGQNVIYAPPGPGALPSINQNVSGQLYADFGGNAQQDQQQVNLQVALTIPPGVDLNAGNSDLELDLKYACKITGVGNLSEVSDTVPNALKIKIDVVSALRARYAGPALAFGDIGLVNAPAGVPDRADQKQVGGAFHVDSSGPYDVSFRTDNGYQLSIGAGANQNIPYELDFMGQTMTAANTGTATKTVGCARAGLSPGRDLPVSATVREGYGKTPSSAYRDTLHVTFTPRTVPTGGPSASCS